MNLNKIVDDIPPKIAEKVKLHKVKVSYYFFKFWSKKNIDKITPWKIYIFFFDMIMTNVSDIWEYIRGRKGEEG